MEREGRSSYVVSVPRVGGSWACVVVVERGRASRDTNTLWCRRRIRCILPRDRACRRPYCMDKRDT